MNSIFVIIYLKYLVLQKHQELQDDWIILIIA